MDPLKKVMVIEDNDSTRVLVQTILESNGYEVIAVENGEKGIELLNQQGVAKSLSAIFLDVLMPGGMNGLDVLTTVKNSSHMSEVPVIMLTTRDMAEDLIQGYNLGADYYIPKPFTGHQLIYGLKMVLEKQDAA